MIWRWLLLGDISRNWMHCVMAVVWALLAISTYFCMSAPHRVEWLMFECWACGYQQALFSKGVIR